MTDIAEKSRTQRQEEIAKLVATGIGADLRATLQDFVARYYEQVDPEDLQERLPADLYGAALSHWNFARKRAPGEARVRAFNPTIEEQGWLSKHTIVEIVNDDMLNRVGSTYVHRLTETTGAKPHEIVRAYLLAREIFGFVGMWKEIEALDGKIDNAAQMEMLVDSSRLIERGTMWFLRSRRLTEDMRAFP